MEILALLIPVSMLLLAVAGWAFLWAVNHNQFTDLDREAINILSDEPNQSVSEKRTQS